MTLIAEDFLLLMLDPSGRPIVDRTKLPRGLAGAVLLELALPGAVRVAEPGESVKAGRLAVVSESVGALSSDLILANALELIASPRPRKPQRVIEKLTSGLREAVAERLVRHGAVTEEHDRVLGIIPRTRYPAADSSRRNALQHELFGVLVDGLTPSPRTAAVISLLSAVGAADKLFDGSDRRVAKKRAKDIAEGDWAGSAVRKSIDAVNAAVVTAAVVASTGGATSS